MRLLTAGESHGTGQVAIIEGLPAGIPVDIESINRALEQRQRGYGRSSRMALEKDCVTVLGGAVQGKTYGGPLSFLIKNRDDRSLYEKDGEPQLIPRPGHVDLAGSLKYGLRDLKIPAERASGRLTAILVAAGAFAATFLRSMQIEIMGWVGRLGGVTQRRSVKSLKEWREAIECSPLRCPDGKAEKKMMALIDEYIEKEDTLGGVIQVVAWGAPPGLGSFAHWDKRLDGRLAQALMSIPGIKGVEIGEGFGLSGMSGSHANDEIYWDGVYRRRTNNAGGIEGGVSNGSEIVLRAVMKPIPTVKKGVSSVNISTRKKAVTEYVRSDTCALPAASVVAESMVSLVLFEAFLEKFQADTFDEIQAHYRDYIETVRRF